MGLWRMFLHKRRTGFKKATSQLFGSLGSDFFNRDQYWVNFGTGFN